MPAITQNKLTPIFALCALLIVAYVLFARYGGGQSSSVKAANPLPAVPVAPGEGAPVQESGMFGLGALSVPPRRADADSPSETLKTVTASNNDLRDRVQKVIEANDLLKQENAKLRNNQAAIVAQVTERVMAEQRLRADRGMETAETEQAGRTKPGGQSPTALGGIVDAATGGYSTMVKSLGSNSPKGIPNGLGYDDATTADAGAASNIRATISYTRHLPVGYKEAKAGDGTVAIVNSAGRPVHQAETTPAAGDAGAGTARAVSKNKEKSAPRPFYTIPENATMTKATLMTALVGRVPVDGRVHDPMQFKLLIGRDNLAANGHRVPDAVAGIVLSGIAIGDMALSCSEGLIQSLTFVFDDGSIKTVSMKRDGAAPSLGGAGGGGQAIQSVTQSNKLAWISDEYGNPCINGKFVTNAPSYLADMVALKTLSVAAQATALAETTTAASPLGSTTAVTGNKGAYVLGQAAGSGVNEVSNWIMRRLNNSFDAVVTQAGGRLVVHFEQEVSIDKAPDGRKLDFGNSQAPAGAAPQLLD